MSEEWVSELFEIRSELSVSQFQVPENGIHEDSERDRNRDPPGFEAWKVLDGLKPQNYDGSG